MTRAHSNMNVYRVFHTISLHSNITCQLICKPCAKFFRHRLRNGERLSLTP